MIKETLSTAKSLQKYEDLLRHRLKEFGYHLSKGKTIEPDQHISLKKTSTKRGFRIADIESGAVVAGEKYDLSIGEVEKFWLPKYTDKQEAKRRERLERMAEKARPKTIQLDGKWTVTNDGRAVRALRDHTERYGNFDANGHGAEGNIADMVYRAYRPYACPEFTKVWPVDGDWSNLTDCNLTSDVDEADLPENIIPITPQRRIWHNQHRIFIKLPIHDYVFFTEWNHTLFTILSDCKVLSGWYIQRQERKSKTVLRLYCRIRGRDIVSLAEIVALFDAGKIDFNDVAGSLLAEKKWLRENRLQVDHIKDNPQNNCIHNVHIVKESANTGKSDVITSIALPYVFLPVRVGNTYRVLCGKAQYHADTNDYSLGSLKMVSCQGVNEFLEFTKVFQKAAKANGDMFPRPNNRDLTNCVLQMFADDGQEYHDGRYNPNERLLRAEEGEFLPWNGDLRRVFDEDPITNGD